jgi:hypothetical protein
MMDAEYFLHALRGKTSREEFRPNLTAFLAISRGILDHLLEAYNVKFGLNIPIHEKLLRRLRKQQIGRITNMHWDAEWYWMIHHIPNIPQLSLERRRYALLHLQLNV